MHAEGGGRRTSSLGPRPASATARKMRCSSSRLKSASLEPKMRTSTNCPVTVLWHRKMMLVMAPEICHASTSSSCTCGGGNSSVVATA